MTFEASGCLQGVTERGQVEVRSRKDIHCKTRVVRSGLMPAPLTQRFVKVVPLRFACVLCARVIVAYLTGIYITLSNQAADGKWKVAKEGKEIALGKSIPDQMFCPTEPRHRYGG